jgi:hypothetical protein
LPLEFALMRDTREDRMAAPGSVEVPQGSKRAPTEVAAPVATSKTHAPREHMLFVLKSGGGVAAASRL